MWIDEKFVSKDRGDQDKFVSNVKSEPQIWSFVNQNHPDEAQASIRIKIKSWSRIQRHSFKRMEKAFN